MDKSKNSKLKINLNHKKYNNKNNKIIKNEKKKKIMKLLFN